MGLRVVLGRGHVRVKSNERGKDPVDMMPETSAIRRGRRGYKY